MKNREKILSKHPYLWLILPGSLFLLLCFILPISSMIRMSFNIRPSTGDVIQTISALNYQKVLTDIYYWRVFLNTILIGFVVTFLTILLGFPLAYKYVHARDRVKEILLVIILGPLLITMVVRIYGWMVILGSNGLINSLLTQLGIIKDPITLMYNSIGVIIGLTHVLLPFMTVSIATALQNIDKSINEAAETLGASKWHIFFKITIPLCKHGIIAGSILVFSLAVSVFVTPMMLGGSGLRSIVVLIYTHGLVLINWPMAAALGALLLLILLIIMFIQYKIQGRTESKDYASV